MDSKKDNRLIKLFNEIVTKRKHFQNNDYVIFGILNVTPDSFSDGGDFIDHKKALDAAKKMYKEGADFIDVGGESTRPGSKTVNSKNETHNKRSCSDCVQ